MEILTPTAAFFLKSKQGDGEANDEVRKEG